MHIDEIPVDEQIGEIGQILTGQQKKQAIVVQALQQIQQDIGYLPEDAVRQLARFLNLSMSEIFSVASFYKMFHFTPRGKKILKVCLGTACYVRGSKKVLEAAENAFNIRSGETTDDLSLTVETVGCIGCCGLAPVSTVNDVVVGELIGIRKVESLLRSLREDA